MIRMCTGDLLDSTAPAIGHGVNIYGLMGAGVAKMIRDRFPDGYRRYRNACRTGALSAGGAQLCPPGVDGDQWLANLASQDRPGPHACLAWVSSSLDDAITGLQENGVNLLALPRIGCGIGGLNFPDVLRVIERVLVRRPGFDIEIWSLPDPVRAG